MIWRRVTGGWNCNPYQVRWTSGGKWMARVSRMAALPTHIGHFATAEEAKAACQEYHDGCEAQWKDAK